MRHLPLVLTNLLFTFLMIALVALNVNESLPDYAKDGKGYTVLLDALDTKE